MEFDIDFHGDAPSIGLIDPDRPTDQFIDEGGDHSSVGPFRIGLVHFIELEEGIKTAVFHLVEPSFDPKRILEPTDDAILRITLFSFNFHNKEPLYSSRPI